MRVEDTDKHGNETKDEECQEINPGRLEPLPKCGSSLVAHDLFIFDLLHMDLAVAAIVASSLFGSVGVVCVSGTAKGRIACHDGRLGDGMIR